MELVVNNSLYWPITQSRKGNKVLSLDAFSEFELCQNACTPGRAYSAPQTPSWIWGEQLEGRVRGEGEGDGKKNDEMG